MKYAVAVALLALAGTAGAQTNTQIGGANAAAAAQSGAIAGSQSGAGAAAVIEQNFNTPAQQRIDGTNTIRSTETVTTHGNLEQDINYSGKYTIRNTPNVAAPNILPTSPCMGSSSVGVGITGFGISGGTSWKDDDCGYRETARVFLQANMAQDGLAVLCSSPYAAAAPTCQKLKPAAAPAKTSDAGTGAKETMIRDMNDKTRTTTLGAMTKSQQDTALTKAAMLPERERKAENCRLAGDDQMMRARFECGIYHPVAFKQ